MCRKEYVQFFRNWVLAFFMLYAFTIMTYSTATSMSKELKNATLVVIDNDQSRSSRELQYRFRPPHFTYAKQLANGSDGVRLLDRGKAAVVLDIPADFEENLYEGRHARLQLQLDGAAAARAYSTRLRLPRTARAV